MHPALTQEASETIATDQALDPCEDLGDFIPTVKQLIKPHAVQAVPA